VTGADMDGLYYLTFLLDHNLNDCCVTFLREILLDKCPHISIIPSNQEPHYVRLETNDLQLCDGNLLYAEKTVNSGSMKEGLLV
jgi:hypothetical protein